MRLYQGDFYAFWRHYPFLVDLLFYGDGLYPMDLV